MPFVDLAFRLTGSKIPVDHGYALYSAISRVLPEIHGAANIGVHPIRGTYSGWTSQENRRSNSGKVNRL